MPKELGTLVVVVLKAKNLNDKHSFYKQDVFTQVCLNGVTKRTPVDVKGGQHPVWDSELRFPVMKETSERHRTLQVSCWAKEPRTEDLLGEGKVDISDTLKTGEFDDWVSLSTSAGARGEVYLEMTYYADAPAHGNHDSLSVNTNLARRPSKLAPADRLARPSQPHYKSDEGRPGSASPNQGHRRTFSPNGTRLAPPSPSSSRSSSASPQGRDSPLPSLPEDLTFSKHSAVPSTLLPGAARSKVFAEVVATTKPVPSILRPGNSQAPVMRPVPSSYTISNAPPPRDPSPKYLSTPGMADQGRGYPPVPGPVPPDYIIRPHSQGSTGYTPSSLPLRSSTTSPTGTAPDPWNRDTPSVPLSFPVPLVSAMPENLPHHPLTTGGPPPPVALNQLANRPPDPYLQTRYHTPLPLPQDSFTDRRQPTPGTSDQARIQALRIAEDEAARRKEQEDRDLELAKQLDRELNLDV